MRQRERKNGSLLRQANRLSVDVWCSTHFSPGGEKLGQILFRARHGRYLVRVLTAARELKIVRETFSFFHWSVLHHGY
jgi:hypothetical protein